MGKSSWEDDISKYGQIDVKARMGSMKPDIISMQRAKMGLGQNACILRCPNCAGEVPARKNTFIMADLDSKIMCEVCSASTASKKWMCKCGDPWHICDKHAGAWEIITHPAANKPPHTKRKASPRKQGILCQGSFEEILDDELKSEAKRARKVTPSEDSCIVLECKPRAKLRASWLPQRLRERFSSSLGED